MLSRSRSLACFPVLALALAASAGAQERTFERTLALEPGGTLALDTTRGSVHLTSWNEPQVEIRARIEPPGGITTTDYARRAVDAVEIDVTGGGDAVRIRSNYDKVPSQVFFGRSLPRVHYEIKAPRQLDLDLDIDRSDVVLQGFEGTLDIVLDRSSLDADDLAGDLALEVDRGPDVAVDGLRGTLDLNLDRTEATLRGVTLSGDSRVEVDRGGVNMEWAANQALTIDGDLDRSNISSDLPITIGRRGSDVHATLNGGGPTLRLHADRSEIRFNSR